MCGDKTWDLWLLWDSEFKASLSTLRLSSRRHRKSQIRSKGFKQLPCVYISSRPWCHRRPHVSPKSTLAWTFANRKLKLSPLSVIAFQLLKLFKPTEHRSQRDDCQSSNDPHSTMFGNCQPGDSSRRCVANSDLTGRKESCKCLFK